MKKIKEIVDTTEVIIRQRQPHNLLKKYSPLLHLRKTQYKEFTNVRIKDMTYVF